MDCSFSASGMNEREVAKKIIQHMESNHNMKVIPADFMIKIKHSIKNKSAIKTVHLGSENKPLIVAMK